MTFIIQGYLDAFKCIGQDIMTSVSAEIDEVYLNLGKFLMKFLYVPVLRLV